MFLDLTRRHELLTDNMYRWKSGLLKSIVILINIQGFVLDSIPSEKVKHKSTGTMLIPAWRWSTPLTDTVDRFSYVVKSTDFFPT